MPGAVEVVGVKVSSLQEEMTKLYAFCLNLGPLAASRQSGNTKDVLAQKSSHELPQAGWQPAVPGGDNIKDIRTLANDLIGTTWERGGFSVKK